MEFAVSMAFVCALLYLGHVFVPIRGFRFLPLLYLPALFYAMAGNYMYWPAALLLAIAPFGRSEEALSPHLGLVAGVATVGFWFLCLEDLRFLPFLPADAPFRDQGMGEVWLDLQANGNGLAYLIVSLGMVFVALVRYGRS